MISQIRHLQSRDPFETFSIELTNGRVIQIHDLHSVATTVGTRPEEAMIGVLHGKSLDDRRSKSRNTESILLTELPMFRSPERRLLVKNLTTRTKKPMPRRLVAALPNRRIALGTSE